MTFTCKYKAFHSSREAHNNKHLYHHLVLYSLRQGTLQSIESDYFLNPLNMGAF